MALVRLEATQLLSPFDQEKQEGNLVEALGSGDQVLDLGDKSLSVEIFCAESQFEVVEL